jgi:hypothetical protein
MILSSISKKSEIVAAVIKISGGPIQFFFWSKFKINGAPEEKPLKQSEIMSKPLISQTYQSIFLAIENFDWQRTQSGSDRERPGNVIIFV